MGIDLDKASKISKRNARTLILIFIAICLFNILVLIRSTSHNVKCKSTNSSKQIETVIDDTGLRELRMKIIVDTNTINSLNKEIIKYKNINNNLSNEIEALKSEGCQEHSTYLGMTGDKYQSHSIEDNFNHRSSSYKAVLYEVIRQYNYVNEHNDNPEFKTFLDNDYKMLVKILNKLKSSDEDKQDIVNLTNAYVDIIYISKQLDLKDLDE